MVRLNLLSKLTFSEPVNQGVLVYYNNRLIRRLENPKMGNLDFLSAQFSNYIENRQQNPGELFFERNGYIELKGDFKPNIFKTVFFLLF